jgi:hypothetical protein
VENEGEEGRLRKAAREKRRKAKRRKEGKQKGRRERKVVWWFLPGSFLPSFLHSFTFTSKCFLP